MRLTAGVRRVLVIATVVLLLGCALAYEIVSTQPVRAAVRTCSELFTIANRDDLSDSQRLIAARTLCSKQYLQKHPLKVAPEGGIVNIPRNINMHFKAWREGPNVWMCPRDRVGPVYQFVFEEGSWRFDGLIANLDRYGRMIQAADALDPDSE